MLDAGEKALELTSGHAGRCWGCWDDGSGDADDASLAGDAGTPKLFAFNAVGFNGQV